jgi:hypothetical protein
MKKIPVWQTIAEAYRFTFAGLERVIAVIWLPIIILTIGDYFVAGPYLTGMANAMETDDGTQVLPLIAGQVGYGLVQLVLVCIIGVAITREILKPLQRPLFLRFSLGVTEMRVAVGIIGLYALLFLTGFICMILGMMLGGSLPMPAMAPGQRAMVIAVLIGLLFSPLLIYAFARLAYFIVPSVVMEGGFGLERSWQLAKANVGRIILIALAVAIPVLMVDVVVQVLVLGPDAFKGQMDLFGDKAAQARATAEQMRELAAHLPLLKGLEFLLAPFMYGLTFAAPAFAFKALTAPGQNQR